MSNEIMEIASFKLKSKVSVERLLTASGQLQEKFLARQPGFVRRHLVGRGEGGYADIVAWADKTSAEAAMRAAMQSPDCADYFELMEMGGLGDGEPGMLIMPVLAAYGA